MILHHLIKQAFHNPIKFQLKLQSGNIIHRFLLASKSVTNFRSYFSLFLCFLIHFLLLCSFPQQFYYYCFIHDLKCCVYTARSDYEREIKNFMASAALHLRFLLFFVLLTYPLLFLCWMSNEGNVKF